MVDFNNDSTVSTPPGDVVKIVILEARQQVTQSIEFYDRYEYQGLDAHGRLAEIYGNVRHLWNQLQASAMRRLKPAKGTEDDPTYEMVDEVIDRAKTYEELKAAFRWMNWFIDDMGLTLVDSRPKYDRRNVEDSNEKKGL